MVNVLNYYTDEMAKETHSTELGLSIISIVRRYFYCFPFSPFRFYVALSFILIRTVYDFHFNQWRLYFSPKAFFSREPFFSKARYCCILLLLAGNCECETNIFVNTNNVHESRVTMILSPCVSTLLKLTFCLELNSNCK